MALKTSKWDQIEQFFQAMAGLHRWTIYNLSGHPVPVIDHPQIKSYFSCVETGFSIFQFVTIAFCQFIRHY